MLPEVVVKPAEGRSMRDPMTRHLITESGVKVPLSAYWRRRIEDGDLTVAEQE